ncbi:MAG: putative ABC transporter permease [Butyrivibrio sp.]|nr:putative ABC transporter permease [Butyrivibrio sp.]
MFNYLPIQWLFLFFFYSFFGWCFESTYVSIMEKHLVNRGFIRGPFLPLYGCGGIMMLIASKPFYDNVLLVFIAGCIGATALEYITGVVMEKLFGVRYWDYSHKKFNFQGQICLESTIVWGVCTVVFTHYMQIPIEMIIMSIPYNIMTVVVVIETIIFSADFAIAFRTALDIRDVLMYMERAKSEMARMQKRLDVLIAFKGEDVKEGIGSRMGGINNRIDALSNSLESSFNIIKQKMAVDPGAYVSRARDEVTELYARYRVVMSRFTPAPVKSIYTWYRNRTIAGNPTMSSTMYKASLEELKERTKES